MKQSEKWARAIVNGEMGPFVILDTETTGLDYVHEPCQIAVVDSKGLVLFDSLIRPTVPIGREAQAIHHITDALVYTAPTLPAVYDQLRTVLDGKLALTYNASFDRGKLRRACEAHGLDDLTSLCKWDCVMEVYASFRGERRYGGGYRWQKLTTACWQMDIPVNNAHNALGDALMTLELLKAMAGVREKV